MAMSDKRAFVDAVRNKYAPSLPPIDADRYGPMKGLEGPFRLRSGKVVYYDPKEGKYYDRDRDMYMSHDEYDSHANPRESVDFFRFAEILNEEAKRRRLPMHGDDKFTGGYRFFGTCAKCGKSYSYTLGGFGGKGICSQCESENLTPEQKDKMKRLKALRKKI